MSTYQLTTWVRSGKRVSEPEAGLSGEVCVGCADAAPEAGVAGSDWWAACPVGRPGSAPGPCALCGRPGVCALGTRPGSALCNRSMRSAMLSVWGGSSLCDDWSFTAAAARGGVPAGGDSRVRCDRPCDNGSSPPAVPTSSSCCCCCGCCRANCCCDGADAVGSALGRCCCSGSNSGSLHQAGGHWSPRVLLP